MLRRTLAALATFCLVACSDEPEPPPICTAHCITEAPPPGAQVTCCDSITCYYDDEAERWETIYCTMGPPPDAGDDAAADASVD